MTITNNTPASLNQRQSLLISSGETGAYNCKFIKININKGDFT